jgi:hypothetical protein
MIPSIKSCAKICRKSGRSEYRPVEVVRVGSVRVPDARSPRSIDRSSPEINELAGCHAGNSHGKRLGQTGLRRGLQ